VDKSSCPKIVRRSSTGELTPGDVSMSTLITALTDEKLAELSEALKDALEIASDWEELGTHELTRWKIIIQRREKEEWPDTAARRAEAFLLVCEDLLTELRDEARKVGRTEMLESVIVTYVGRVRPARFSDKESFEDLWKPAGTTETRPSGLPGPRYAR